jgi:predicted nucleic-acid-binding protein
MKTRRVVDTNILIRLLTKDDLEQYQTAYKRSRRRFF